MTGDSIADRYVRWLYRQASGQPDLTLLDRVASAVAALREPPADLAANVHDELAIVLAALPGHRQQAASALARLRPGSPVLTAALTDERTRAVACVALAGHLTDPVVLERYRCLLASEDPAVLTDALAGLAPPPGGAIGRSVPSAQLPAKIKSGVAGLLAHPDGTVVASALRVLAGRELPPDLPAAPAGRAGAAIAEGARLMLSGPELPVRLLAELVDLLPGDGRTGAALGQLILAGCELPDDLLARLGRMLTSPDPATADRAASLLQGRELPMPLLAVMANLLEHADPPVAARALIVLAGRELPAPVQLRLVGLLGHDSAVVVGSAVRLLSGLDLSEDVLDQVLGLLEHRSPAVVVAALALLGRRDLPDNLLSRIVTLLEHGDPEVVTGASAILVTRAPADPAGQPGRAVPAPVLAHINALLAARNPAVQVSTLELLPGRELPADLVARMVDLLGHPDPAVSWSSLAALADRPLPGQLISHGIACLLSAGLEDDVSQPGRLGCFLRDRELAVADAEQVVSWLNAAPLARWPALISLRWPAELAGAISAQVRVLAAQTASATMPAISDLAAAAVQRWLNRLDAPDPAAAPGPAVPTSSPGHCAPAQSR